MIQRIKVMKKVINLEIQMIIIVIQVKNLELNYQIKTNKEIRIKIKKI